MTGTSDVIISVQNITRTPINKKLLLQKLTAYFNSLGKSGKYQFDVSIISALEMKRLGKTYLKETDRPAHNVLTFTASESAGFASPPDGVTHLGEIVVCEETARKEAKDEGVDYEKRVFDLAAHGVLHLLGIHHK